MIHFRRATHYTRPSVALATPWTTSFGQNKEQSRRCTKPFKVLQAPLQYQSKFCIWAPSPARRRLAQNKFRAHCCTVSCTSATAKHRRTSFQQSSKTQRHSKFVPLWHLHTRLFQKSTLKRNFKLASTRVPFSSRPTQSSHLSSRRHNVDTQQDTGGSAKPAHDNSPSSGYKNLTNLLGTKRLSRRPTAAQRASERKQQACSACGGRGFQIVDEELQACPACNGANWDPAPAAPFQSQQIHIDDSVASKRSAAGKGRKRSGGRPLSQAARDKIRATMKGRRWTEEHRRAISESMKGVHNAEHRSRISASMTARPKVCSYCGVEGHNRRGCLKLHPEKTNKESKTVSSKSVSSKTVRICTHCGSSAHSRRTCPQFAATSSSSTATADASTATKTIRMTESARKKKAAQALGAASSQTQVQSVAGAQTSPTTGKGVQAGSSPLLQAEEVQAAGSNSGDEATAGRAQTCSYCGGRGHNQRTCPELAKARKEEELVKQQQKFGPLWGLTGVEEHRMRGGKEKAWAFPVPDHVEEAVSQAAAAVMRAYEAGVRRHRLKLLLPQAGNTSAQSSWPGGIRQQAQVAIPSLIEPLLKLLKQHPNLQGRMGAEWIDESDCVGAWQNSGLAAVMFPTADTLPQVRQIARVKGPHRLMLVINPQWQMNGQIVSDFGFGRGKADAEKFLGAFQDVYCLERVRILGDDLRLLKSYPGNWQVHYTWPNGRGSVLVGVEPTRPSYERLLQLLKSVPGTRASRSWVDRVLDINKLPGLSGDEGVQAEISESLGLDVPLKQALPPPNAKQRGASLRQRLQDMLTEQGQSEAASTSDAPAQQASKAEQPSVPKAFRSAIPTGDPSGGPEPVQQRAQSSRPRKADDALVANVDGQQPLDPDAEEASLPQDFASIQSKLSRDRRPEVAAAEASIAAGEKNMVDRFGSADGKPSRDLKMDPVLQLAKWRESIFGSRDSVSESRDSVSESIDNEDG